MNALEERNTVWHLLELIIEKHLTIDSEYLDPTAEDQIEFGNFVKGHPMCFEQCFSECMAEITRKIPSDYKVTKSAIIGTGEGVIGLTKI